MVSFPLPLYKSVRIGGISQHEQDFDVIVGLDEKLVTQLKAYSSNEDDISLMENTSDLQRFGKGSYEDWYAKKRTPFALVNAKTGTLAAIAWFGPKSLGEKSMKHLSENEIEEARSKDPGNWHTISYRCYGEYRGKGLMKNFVQVALNTYQKAFPEAKLWTIAGMNNAPSNALARSLGFNVSADFSETDSVVMIKN